MGCSSSRDTRGDVGMPAAPAPAERRQSLRSRSLSRAASAFSSLGLCCGRHDSVHAYSRLSFEEMMKGANDAVAADALPGEEEAAEEGRCDAPRTPTKTRLGGQRGLMAALEDAWPASSITAQWHGSLSGCRGEPSSPPPVQPLPDFDPGIMSGFRQTVLGPSPSHPALLFQERENPPPQETNEETFDDTGTPAARDIPEVTGFVRARVDEFHEKIEKKKKKKKKKKRAADEAPNVVDDVAPLPRPARAGKAAVVYFTSLHGVRRTFEDGRTVSAILRCYRVRVDERDVSMHAGFKAELRELLGPGFAGPTLPRVFVDRRHDLGGADDVRALHEAGALARALAGCELAAPVSGCAACGEMRFLLCETCYGSCKVFAGDEECRLASIFRRCPDCNENGLIRCPVCCY